MSENWTRVTLFGQDMQQRLDIFHHLDKVYKIHSTPLWLIMDDPKFCDWANGYNVDRLTIRELNVYRSRLWKILDGHYRLGLKARSLGLWIQSLVYLPAYFDL